MILKVIFVFFYFRFIIFNQLVSTKRKLIILQKKLESKWRR